jgi:hypothetical protein
MAKSNKVSLKNFNPLAPTPVAKADGPADSEKAMRDLIKQDVNRTCQEFAYFREKSTKDALTAILFLWGKENPDFQYKQGMNEILAMVLIVFSTEAIQPSGKYARNEAGLDVSQGDAFDEAIVNGDLVAEYLLDGRETFADVYMTFDRVMHLGI